jgi:hypothetical protein
MLIGPGGRSVAVSRLAALISASRTLARHRATR